MKKLITIFSYVGFAGNIFAQNVEFDTPKAIDSFNKSGVEHSKPLISADGLRLFYTETIFDNKKRIQNIGIADWVNGNWIPIGDVAMFNNANSNAVVGVSFSGDKIYLSGNYNPKMPTHPGVSFIEIKENEFSEVQDFKMDRFNFYGEFIDYFITPDENFLLISMFSKDSHGELDLYVSAKQINGTWGMPVNLGKRINSTGSEISPYLSPDGKILFFASNGHQGLGGYDIFMSKRLDNSFTNWSEPVNLGAEINSSGFDAYFSLGTNKDAYFVSKRDDSETSKIFFTRYRGNLLEVQTPKVSEATGTTKDAEKSKSGKSDGCEEPCKQIEAMKSEFNQRLGSIERKNKEFFREVSPEKAIAVPKPIYVFFKINSATIDEEFKAELTEAAEFLKANTNFSILLTGHTDKRGNQDYNRRLAEKRAKACRDFLINAGVKADKIVLNSFGSERSISENIFTDEAQNRRVELHFKRD